VKTQLKLLDKRLKLDLKKMATFKNSESGRPAGDLGKLNPSHSELEALGNALKSQEFRAMLCDYAREVSDPKNKALARSEMFQMEADQAIHATFLTPNPGYVIKTSVVSNNNTGSGDQDLAAVIGLNGKVFVNICSDENIKDAFKRDNMSSDPQGRVPWGFPYSTAKPRRDVDKAGQECVVFDVLFNTNVIGRAEGNIRFRNMVNSTALEGIEAAFNLKLDRKRLRFPKLKFKGSIHTTVMRRPMTDQELEEYQESKTKTEDHQEPNLETVKDVVKKEPKYAIKYRHSTQDVPLLADHGVTDPCRPSEMIVEVSLPEMTSAKGIDLDVLEHLMTLESEVPVAYKLVLKLPYPVFEDQGAAKFDKSQHSLVVTLPVKAANKEPVSRLISTDSGIGLDFDNTEAEAVVIDDTAYRTNSDQVLEDQVRRNLPPYNCNIYEGLMVLTIPVQNVVVDSLDRQLLEGNKGYQLSFQTLGQGFVPMEYGFCLAFDFESEVGSCSLEDLEIEVWDNNMILQLCIPKSGCSNFCVGTYKGDLGDAMPLPRLEAVKDKCFMLNKVKTLKTLQGCVIVVLQGCVIVVLQGCVIVALQGCVIVPLRARLRDAMPLPRLEAVKDKCFMLNKVKL
jgi:dynein assembly factor 2